MPVRAVLVAVAATAVAAAAAVALWLWRTGGDAVHDQSRDAASAELDSRGPCPAQLPAPRDDSGYGFGSDSGASGTPALSDQTRAWTCTYEAVGSPRDDGNGTYYRWDLTDGPASVPADAVPDLVRAVNDLDTPPGEYGCNADLGPRVLVVLATADDNLTGVSVDVYGCREVRLTADPWGGAPGETPAPGVPAGVLVDGRSILPLLSGG